MLQVQTFSVVAKHVWYRAGKSKKKNTKNIESKKKYVLAYVQSRVSEPKHV